MEQRTGLNHTPGKEGLGGEGGHSGGRGEGREGGNVVEVPVTATIS